MYVDINMVKKYQITNYNEIQLNIAFTIFLSINYSLSLIPPPAVHGN